MKRSVLLPALFFVLPASCALAQAGSYHWFKFKKDSITTLYQGELSQASIAATTWTAAGTVHDTSCNGKDGELHIGIFNAGLTDPASVVSLTDSEPDKWGQVAELPEASKANGPATLDAEKGKPQTFTGYLRVWNEGHDHGQIFDSNPHHVFEVHPILKIEGNGSSFEDASLIISMQNFHGYGASKFRPMLKSISDGNWPLAYQDGTFLYVKLRQEDNFYQLPVKVTNNHSTSGGHIAAVDVYSDAALKHRRYQDLRCVTVSGSEYDGSWQDGKKDFLLGFFSVNLAKALDASSGAHTEADAVAVPDALEFFVFGSATGSAVASCP